MTWKDEIFGYTAADFARLFEQDFGYKPDYHPPQSAAALLVYHHALQISVLGCYRPLLSLIRFDLWPNL